MSTIGPSTYGTLDRLLAGASSLNSQISTLTQQTTTGRIATSYAGVAASSSQILDLTAASAHAAAYTQTIATAQGKAAVMQDALTQIGSLVGTVSASALNLGGTSPSSTVASVAQQAKLAFQQVVSLLNTTNSGDYVFAGADTAHAPVPSPNTATTSGMFTQIGTAMSALTVVPTTPAVATVIASTVSAASSTAAGTTIFSAYLTGAGMTAAPGTIQIADNQKISLDLPANQNVGAVSDPAIHGTGGAINDILRSLAVIANGTGAMASNPDFATVMKDAVATLNSAGSTLSQMGGQLGLTQTALTSATTAHASVQLLLAKQLTGLTDVDAATAISKLQAVSNQLQVSYKVLSLARSLTLANYL